MIDERDPAAPASRHEQYDEPHDEQRDERHGKQPEHRYPQRRWWSPAPRGAWRSGVVVGVAVALLAAGGLVVGRGGTGVRGEHAATAASRAGRDREVVAGEHQHRDGVADMLARRATALLRHDREAFLATVDPRLAAFRARQLTWFDNLADVPLASWHHELNQRARPTAQPGGSPPLGTDGFTARVTVGYRLAGYDRVPQYFERTLTFGRWDGVWFVAGDSATTGAAFGTTLGAPGSAPRSAAGSVPGPAGGTAGEWADRAATRSAGGPRQLWELGRVRVVRARHGLVLGLAPARSLRASAREVDRAVPKVLDVWHGAWSGQVVVVVPRTEQQMAALLGGGPAQYRRLAAVTRGELGTTEDSAPANRVFINPAAFRKLSLVGRQVVLAHEITHVASRAQTQSWTPKWLSEGLADYVAYRGSGLPVRVIAQELATGIRRGDALPALPDNRAFRSTGPDLPHVYEQSWLACRLIAERYGQQALLRFYAAVGEGSVNKGRPTQGRGNANLGAPAVERAFRAQLATTQARFTSQWRAYVRRQLR